MSTFSPLESTEATNSAVESAKVIKRADIKALKVELYGNTSNHCKKSLLSKKNNGI
jgi:hypothetical protein